MDYPASALRVKFKPLTGVSHTYRVWKIGSRWGWFVLGNSGVADTMEDAMRCAREYITMGVGGMTRESRHYYN